MNPLDPRNLPQFQPGICRYHTAALAAGRAIAEAGGYLPLAFCVPGDSDVDVAARSPFEARLVMPPGSYLVALSGSSAQEEGFEMQVTDLGTGQSLFPRRTKSALILSAGTTPAPFGEQITQPLFYLPRPMLFLEPGLVSVQVWNLANVQNTIQLVLHVATPEVK